MNRIFYGLLLAVVSVFFLVGCGSNIQSSQEQSEQGALGTGIFELSFEDYDGTSVSLNDVRGKPLVVNSWAGWCSFCKKELVDFAIVQKEFGDSVMIIAINRSENAQKAKEFSDGAGDTSGLTFWVDRNDSFYKTIGGFAMPETIFVDADGNIVFHKRGPMDTNEIRDRINALLGVAKN